jgi:5-methylcytosine-specific restriction protein A
LAFSSDRSARATQPPQAEPHWKAWYKTARWQRLRQQVLIRDNYTCQRTGQLCTGKHPAPNSPVVNHTRAHRGNEALFWDIDNLETITKAEHDAAVQREEQASRHHVGTWD